MVKQGPKQSPLTSALLVVVAFGLAGCVLWAYAPTLTAMANRWSRDPQYSHGFLVPVFALVILWIRRPLAPSHWPEGNRWGLAVLAAAFGLRTAGAYLFLDALDGLALPLCLAGLVLLLAGWPGLRWAWPPIAFLIFLLPLPYTLESAMGQPLRRLGTVASTFTLQLLGFPALNEGNVIVIDELKLGVIDACNGLGMLMTFFALATAFAMVMQRPWPDRLLLVASAVPIALAANVARITATAVAHANFGSATADAIMHDLAGWLMMPLALVMLWAEQKYLDRLLESEDSGRPVPLTLGLGALPVALPRTPGSPVMTAAPGNR